MNKKTVILGASPNPSRYAYLATSRMHKRGIEVIPIGVKTGEIEGIKIQHGTPSLSDIHTVSLYINPSLQKAYYDYILGLNPKRIIFNPGTENIELLQLAKKSNIETMIACTLVLLSTESY